MTDRPRILVTGANGQVGRAMLRAAHARSLVAVGCTRTDLDITDSVAVASMLAEARADLIVNAAAYTAVDRAESERTAAFAGNATGPRILAEAAAHSGVPLVHISTDYVFDGSKDGAWQENDACAPLGVYGESKLAGEQAVAGAGAEQATLRVAWVFSADGGNFAKTMIRLARSRDHLRIVGDQMGTPTPAATIADAILCLAANRTRLSTEGLWGLYHLPTSPAVSWADFAEAVLAGALERGLIGAVPTIERIGTADYPTPARRPANSVLDGSRWQRTFPDHPLQDWHTGLDDVLDRLAAEPALLEA